MTLEFINRMWSKQDSRLVTRKAISVTELMRDASLSVYDDGEDGEDAKPLVNEDEDGNDVEKSDDGDEFVFEHDDDDNVVVPPSIPQDDLSSFETDDGDKIGPSRSSCEQSFGRE